MSSEEEKRLNAMEEAEKNDPYKEVDLEELIDVLGTTIKHDRFNKAITFLVMLGTYSDEEQSNLMYRSETTTGKSYIPLEIIDYFPEEDVEKVGYASPTSFFHKYGKKQQTTKTIKMVGEKPVTESHTFYLIDMSKKIYIFKDMPSTQLLERLRSLLSHDERQLEIQFTNKNEKSGYRTQHMVIRGFPTVIFCTAAAHVLDMQESTRFLVLSPEIDEEKIKEAILLLAKRKGNKKLYSATLDADAKRYWLKQRIRNVKAEDIIDVIIPNETKIAEDFIKSKEHLQPRHMRDFGRLLCLIKYWAIFNCWNRQTDKTDKGKVIYANDIDIEVGFILYESICEANELGISPEVHHIYKEVFEKNDSGTGLSKEQISASYLNMFHRPLGDKRLNKEILPNLLAVGLIYEVEGTGVGGKPKIYRCTKYMEEKEEANGKQTMLLSTQQNGLKSLQEKIEFVFGIFAPNMPLSLDNILKQTQEKIPNGEVQRILTNLLDAGKIFQPNDYSYQRVM